MADPRKKIRASAQHLTAWQMAKIMGPPGLDRRGWDKGRMVEELLKHPDSIDSLCLAFRMHINARGVAGVTASDVVALERKLEVARLELRIHLEYKEKREAYVGRKIPGLESLTLRHEKDIKRLEWLLDKAKSRA
jgi:hypothetical protein